MLEQSVRVYPARSPSLLLNEVSTNTYLLQMKDYRHCFRTWSGVVIKQHISWYPGYPLAQVCYPHRFPGLVIFLGVLLRFVHQPRLRSFNFDCNIEYCWCCLKASRFVTRWSSIVASFSIQLVFGISRRGCLKPQRAKRFWMVLLLISRQLSVTNCTAYKRLTLAPTSLAVEDNVGRFSSFAPKM